MTIQNLPAIWPSTLTMRWAYPKRMAIIAVKTGTEGCIAEENSAVVNSMPMNKRNWLPNILQETSRCSKLRQDYYLSVDVRDIMSSHSITLYKSLTNVELQCHLTNQVLYKHLIRNCSQFSLTQWVQGRRVWTPHPKRASASFPCTNHKRNISLIAQNSEAIIQIRHPKCEMRFILNDSQEGQSPQHLDDDAWEMQGLLCAHILESKFLLQEDFSFALVQIITRFALETCAWGAEECFSFSMSGRGSLGFLFCLLNVLA